MRPEPTNQGPALQRLAAQDDSDGCDDRDLGCHGREPPLVPLQHLQHSGLHGWAKADTSFLPEGWWCNEHMMAVPGADSCEMHFDDGGDTTLLINKGNEFE